MYYLKFEVVKLDSNRIVLSNRIFLYIENELSTSTEVIDAYFIPEVSNYNT